MRLFAFSDGKLSDSVCENKYYLYDVLVELNGIDLFCSYTTISNKLCVGVSYALYLKLIRNATVYMYERSPKNKSQPQRKLAMQRVADT